MQRVEEIKTGKQMTPDEAEAFRKNFCWTLRDPRGKRKIYTLKNDIPRWSTYLKVHSAREDAKEELAYWAAFQMTPGGDAFSLMDWKQGYMQGMPKKVPSKYRKVLFNHNSGFNQIVSLFQGDICSLDIDCIVNAANNAMLGGGGIDGAIHRRAGPWLVEDCRVHQRRVLMDTEWGPEEVVMGCADGDAKLTRGFCLPARYISFLCLLQVLPILHTHTYTSHRYVIATVGPRIHEDRYGRIVLKPKVLSSCYIRCLELAKKHKLRSIAFNSISTGIFGYPVHDAALVALKSLRKWLEKSKENAAAFDRIIFCTYSDDDTYAYQNIMPALFPASDMKVGSTSGGGGGLFGLW